MNSRAGDGVIGVLMAKSSFRNILKKLGLKNRTGTVASVNAYCLLPQPAIARVPKRIIIEYYRDYNQTIRNDDIF